MTIASVRTSTSSIPAPAGTPSVSAVLVVRHGAPWLAETLEALGRQHRRPDRLVVVDARPAGTGIDLAAEAGSLDGAGAPLAVLRADAATTFGGCVALAVARLDADGVAASALDWLWLLHDDGAPSAPALQLMLDAARQSPAIAIAGPKHTTWSDEGRLREVGRSVTRSGRRAGGPSVGEPDQGQHDSRADVLGVSSSGMLVRRDVFAALGGFEPAFAPHADDLDLCWRAHLAGHRVVVVPAARVREAAAHPSGEHGGDRRRAGRTSRRAPTGPAGRPHPQPAGGCAAARAVGPPVRGGLRAAAAPAQAAAAGPGRAGRRRGPAAPLADDRRPVARPRPATGAGPRPARAVRAAAGRRPGHRRPAP